MSVINITQANFQEEVINSNKPVLVDFWASWCGPCRMVSPIVDEIAEEREDIKVCKINVDEQPELAAAYQVNPDADGLQRRPDGQPVCRCKTQGPDSENVLTHKGG